MFRTLRSRRRPRYGAQVCAFVSAVLLLLSVSLLHTRLSLSPQRHHLLHKNPQNDAVSDRNPLITDTLLSDSDELNSSNDSKDDKIDEFDTIDEDQNDNALLNDEEEDLIRGAEFEEQQGSDQRKVSSSGHYFDHVNGAIRRAFNKRSIDEWDYDYAGFSVGLVEEDPSKAAFGSDDLPVDEEVRRKIGEVAGIEDALLLKLGKRVSPLREKWGDWFDKKSDFLRRDRMFKSNLEILNPLNHPMLQDPDGVGVTGLTRGDRVVQKWLLNEFKRVPFLAKKPLTVPEITHKAKLEENGVELRMDNSDVVKSAEDGKKMIESGGGGRSVIRKAERRTLDANASNMSDSERVINVNEVWSSSEPGNSTYESNKSGNEWYGKEVDNTNGNLSSSANDNLLNESGRNSEGMQDLSIGELRRLGKLKNVDSKAESQSEFSSHIYADGKRWGYYPGLHPRLSFLDFMDAFFRKGKCTMRVFMVWNSPPWMYSVRHQRGLESLLSHHPDACVVLFSETIELDFFEDSFVKDGYKVAVAMPNLDELLKNTPTHIFSSVWFEWRKTKFYSTHYSELVRLAALYRYGGIYIDSDIIVLKPLSLLINSVGLEDQVAGSSLNGAVMAFRKHSPFIMQCLKEFYLTYDDTRLRWNGADLLTRVARSFRSNENTYVKQLELKVQPHYIFFPISFQNVSRYFTTPATEIEKAQQDVLFKKIMNESLTFHFWNSLTSALIPDPDSLVTRLIDHSCIRCFDVL